jgi:hypothetical protein
MVEINWSVLTYFVIALFALNGFFKGWWRAAITTIFLVFLLILLKQPTIAQWVIDTINSALAAIWSVLPDTLRSLLESILQNVFAISTNGAALQADGSKPGTWLIILASVLGLTSLIGHLLLPADVRRSSGIAYIVRPMGSLLGGLVGALNGFIVVNLVREYLDGRNLPTGPGGPPAEVAFTNGGGTVQAASSGLSIQAVQLPNITILDSILPWIIIVAGALIFLLALNSRIGLRSRDGYRKVEYRPPLGYQRREY